MIYLPALAEQANFFLQRIRDRHALAPAPEVSVVTLGCAVMQNNKIANFLIVGIYFLIKCLLGVRLKIQIRKLSNKMNQCFIHQMNRSRLQGFQKSGCKP